MSEIYYFFEGEIETLKEIIFNDALMEDWDLLKFPWYLFC